MQDGEYTIYVVQGRRTHESILRRPDGPLKPSKKGKWGLASFDSFGSGWEPSPGSKSHAELWNNYHRTGYHGYTTMSYALKALKRLHEASEAGRFDSRDTYKVWHQALRHEFRLVKLELSKKTTVVELADAARAM